YRRDDSSGHTELLHSRLKEYFGEVAVFRDVHSIQPMDEFPAEIQAALAEAAIVLVVISKQWSSIAGPDGVRRLDQPDDVVSGEISTALSEHIPILPILFGGAAMPKSQELPERIRRLASFNAHAMSE